MSPKTKLSGSLEDLHKQCLDLKSKGDWEEASERFSLLIDRAKFEKDVGLLLEGTISFADCETRRGNYRVAVDSYMAALKIAEDSGDDLTRAAVLRGLGYVHWRKGDINMALVYFDMVLGQLAGDKDPALLGKTYVDLGNVYTSMLNAAKGEEHYKKGIEMLRDLDSEEAKFDLARAYNNLGSLNNQQGFFARAIEHLEKCIKLSRERKDSNNMAWAMINAAYSYTQLKNFDKARLYLNEAQRVVTDLDDKVAEMAALHVFGTLSHRTGQPDEARDAFETSIGIGRDLDLPEEVAQVQKDFGIFLCETGARDEGLGVLKEALATYTELKSATAGEIKGLIKKYGG